MSAKKNDGLTTYQRYYRRVKAERPDSLAAYQAAWRCANPEKARAYARASYARHAEARRAAKRAAFQALKEAGYSDAHRLKDRLKKSARAALKQGAIATLTTDEWAAICAAHDHRCAYCGVQRPLEQDHVIPLTKGGSHTSSNVVPACKPCNASKGNRWPTPAVMSPSCQRRQVIGTARLTEEDVRRIRAIGKSMPQKELAAMFRVGQSQISRVLLRRAWGWLP